MSDAESRLRFVQEASEPFGEVRRCLAIGPWTLVFEGLDERQAGLLDRRMGGFLSASVPDTPQLRLRLFRGSEESTLGRWAAGESYRIEAERCGDNLLVRSYSFALCREPSAGAWRAGVVEATGEPPARILENVVRYLAARLAVDEGGFALHAGSVLREGSAYVFAGPSRSGKSTAVALSSPAASLGDDFAILVPRKTGWVAPAVPFDTVDAPPEAPSRKLFPVAGVWRLYQAAEPWVETLATGNAVASLMGCVAFSSAAPDAVDVILRRALRFVRESRFRHLHFRKDPDFWDLILLGSDGR